MQKFKTTIKCSGCVANVTNVLNETVGKDKWQVDLQSADKVLTIDSTGAVNQEAVIRAVEKAGYKAEKID